MSLLHVASRFCEYECTYRYEPTDETAGMLRKNRVYKRLPMQVNRRSRKEPFLIYDKIRRGYYDLQK